MVTGQACHRRCPWGRRCHFGGRAGIVVKLALDNSLAPAQQHDSTRLVVVVGSEPFNDDGTAGTGSELSRSIDPRPTSSAECSVPTPMPTPPAGHRRGPRAQAGRALSTDARRSKSASSRKASARAHHTTHIQRVHVVLNRLSRGHTGALVRVRRRRGRREVREHRFHAEEEVGDGLPGWVSGASWGCRRRRRRQPSRRGGPPAACCRPRSPRAADILDADAGA